MEGYHGLSIFGFLFRGRFWIFFWVPGSMLSCFSDFLLFCFSVFLLRCFPCFSAFVLLCLSTTFSFLQSCVFAALLPAPLLPVFAVSLFFIFFCFILFCLYPKWNPRETLGEIQRNHKEILIRNPTWSPKWTLKKPHINQWNPKETLNPKQHAEKN